MSSQRTAVHDFPENPISVYRHWWRWFALILGGALSFVMTSTGHGISEVVPIFLIAGSGFLLLPDIGSSVRGELLLRWGWWWVRFRWDGISVLIDPVFPFPIAKLLIGKSDHGWRVPFLVDPYISKYPEVVALFESGLRRTFANRPRGLP